MSSSDPILILWFRQDLRLQDNPALLAAMATGYRILPLYILEESPNNPWKMGGASRWWLHKSLASLNITLQEHLCLQKGQPLAILKDLVKKHNVQAIYWNRLYEPHAIKRDKEIKATFKQKGIDVKSFNGSLLFSPPQLIQKNGAPYKVFSAFYRQASSQAPELLREPLPSKIPFQKEDSPDLTDLGLYPSIPWHTLIEKEWSPGEAGALRRLETFLDKGLRGYKKGRDYPALPHVSRLSPHLHFGEISPHRVWHKTTQRVLAENLEQDGDCFLRELGWREFSYYLLYHFPTLPEKNLHEKFDKFPWQHNEAHLKAWQRGQTGYPLIDAGMRELWQTGYMHNRVRMIVASFLVKNLRLHWHQGEAWFWDTLLDADLANNSASWQWVAGSGADASPYFRIFNPVLQGQKFDPQGTYVRQYVPEIRGLPDKFIHNPWDAPPSLLDSAHIKLGIDYPEPIIDLKRSREEALAAFHTLNL